MKIYTTFSKSHECFLPWFKTIYDVEPSADVTFYEIEQKCKTGEFKSEGWNDATAEKLKHIIQIFDEDKNDYFIFCDIDVQFFKPFTHLIERVLQNHDIVFQNDYYGAQCTGFFFCRNTPQIKVVFEKALEINSQYRDDQEAIQASLNLNNKNIRHALLPPEFFTFGMYYDMWNGQDNFLLPKNIILHHANWALGIQNKLKLLQIVRDRFNKEAFF